MAVDLSKVFTGSIPPGFDVNAAIKLAQEKAATLSANDLLNWFNNMVRNNKDGHLPQDISWDFKQINTGPLAIPRGF